MRNVLTIFRRELGSYFATPLAYVFIVIFLVMAGVLTFFLGNFFERGQADLQPFFAFHPWLYLVLIPALSMRLWAEERKSGTIELFLTLPIRHDRGGARQIPRRLVLRRHRAGLTFPFWITVNLSRPARQRRDPGELYRQLADGRRVSRDRRLRLGADQEPGHRLRRHRGASPSSSPQRLAGGARAVRRAGRRNG